MMRIFGLRSTSFDSYCQFSDFFFSVFSFSSAVSRLFELGVPTEQFVTKEPWVLKTLDEQSSN